MIIANVYDGATIYWIECSLHIYLQSQELGCIKLFYGLQRNIKVKI